MYFKDPNFFLELFTYKDGSILAMLVPEDEGKAAGYSDGYRKEYPDCTLTMELLPFPEALARQALLYGEFRPYGRQFCETREEVLS